GRHDQPIHQYRSRRHRRRRAHLRLAFGPVGAREQPDRAEPAQRRQPPTVGQAPEAQARQRARAQRRRTRQHRRRTGRERQGRRRRRQGARRLCAAQPACVVCARCDLARRFAPRKRLRSHVRARPRLQHPGPGRLCRGDLGTALNQGIRPSRRPRRPPRTCAAGRVRDTGIASAWDAGMMRGTSMSQAVGGAGNKTAAKSPALKTLASRTDLPIRVHGLLEGVLALCSSGLERALVSTLNEVEMQLFKLAEQGRSHEQQHRCFETLREIKRGRSDVAPRYMLAMEDALACFDQRGTAAAEVAKVLRHPAHGKQELSLVDTSELEESLALQEFAAKTEVRQAQQLYALGHRFGVLAGAPMFEAEALPIGPLMLGEALRRASEGLDIATEHRVLLYRTFDRMTVNAVGSFYEALNTYFIEHRILRHLRLQAPIAKIADRDREQPATPPDPQAGREPMAPQPLHSPSPGFGARQPAPGSYAQTQAHAATPGAPSWAGVTSQPAAGDDRDSELFATLRELLAGRRHALGLASTPVANAYVPNSDDVQAVLGALQSKPISPLMLGGKLVQRSVAHLKQDLLAHLRQFAPEGRAPHLGAEDSDTI